MPPRLDVVIAAAFTVMVLSEPVVSTSIDRPGLYLVFATPAMALLAWRRVFPLTVALVIVVVNFALNPDGQLTTLLTLVLVTFTVGSETEPPRSYLGLGVVLVPFVGLLAMEDLEPSDLAAALVFLVGPWVVGSTLRQRGRHVAEAVARAERLEREQALEAEAAATRERTRIARELHDIVSHSISVVTVQTQAVRRRLGPEHAREAADLAAVEATARDAMTELRRLFGVLRTDGERLSLAPQPGLAELDRLLEQVRGTGLAVRIEREEGSVELSAGLDLAAYRILQEALTNAMRHSRASEVSVRIGQVAGVLHLVVEDNGNGMTPGKTGHGHGLIGIRERAELYGGVIEIGRSDRGGTRVEARLPVGGAT